MTFARIVRDIKALKIQGAQTVAKQALNALEDIVKTSKAKTGQAFLLEIEKACRVLKATRPTEPCMRNALHYAAADITGDSVSGAKQQLSRNIEATLRHFSFAEQRIAVFGANKILPNMQVFTHCHSSTVVRILKMAKEQGKLFSLSNTETRPSFQGRITATAVAKLKIPVSHYVDSAAHYALRKADLVLLGVDAITFTGAIVNKVGTQMIAQMAHDYHIPVYACSDSWKFDPQTKEGLDEPMEVRDPREVWPKFPKGVAIKNHAFDLVDPDLFSGIISELGVFKPELFVREVEEAYPWLVK